MARSFAGSGNFITIGTSSILRPSGALSLFAWFNPSALTNDSAAIASNWNGGTGIGIFIHTSGRMQYYAAGSGVDPGASTLSTGQWTHVGMTLSSQSSGTLTGYANGISEGTVGSIGSIPFNGTFYIGLEPATNYLIGLLADVAMWNVALSVEEIKALVRGERPYMIRSGSLLGYWPLDGLSSPEPDLSGNQLNGTVTGTTSVTGPPMTLFTPRRTFLEGITSVPPVLMGQAML